MSKSFNFRYIKFDILGGLTAGIVALPLAMAFGEQSGLGAVSGLYGAAFIAFFASLFGGTPTQISGPTAPMTALSMVVIAGVMQACEGKIEVALPIVLSIFLLGGLIQIALGLLKLGSFVKFIPHTVVSGFMTGIGVIILITQILPVLGYYSGDDQAVIEQMKPHAEELILDRILLEEAQDGVLVLEEFNQTIEAANEITPEDILIEARLLATNDSRGVNGSVRYAESAIKNINILELLLALATILIIYGFKLITKAVPSTLVALAVVSVTAYLMKWDYVQISAIPMSFPEFHLDIFTGIDLGIIAPYLISALLLAMLGSIDSLLTSVVADNMTRTRHDPNQELIGQGIGNSVAAFFGGLPGSGATIRTVVNIQAGGKTKISGMVAGLFLFIVMILLAPIASQIPAAVLAGILVTVGFGVMDHKGLKSFPKLEISEKIIMLTVLLLTVFWQLVYAVAIGMVMASFVFLKRMSDLSNEKAKVQDLKRILEQDPLWDDEKEIPSQIREKILFKHLSGPMFFGMVNDFRNLISLLPEIHLLVIRMEKMPFMDLSAVRALEAAIEELHAQDVIVVLTGYNDKVEIMLNDLGVIPEVIDERHMFKEFKDCRKWVRSMVSNELEMENELAKLKRLS